MQIGFDKSCVICSKNIDDVKDKSEISFYHHKMGDMDIKMLLCSSECVTSYEKILNTDKLVKLPTFPNLVIEMGCWVCGKYKKDNEWIAVTILKEISDSKHIAKMICCSVSCFMEVKSKCASLCENCNKYFEDRSRLLKCKTCRSVTYCSKQCQKNHWEIHKKDCKENVDWNKLRYKTGSDESKHTCVNCFKHSKEKFQCCSGCKLYYYCSVECQKEHWPTHKKDCKSM